MLVHGMCKAAEYLAWRDMKRRCLNPNTPNYKRYGGRGIKVCDKWLTFVNFYEDMGDRPEGMSLDRRDNDGDYCKENCRWATRKEQDTNTSRNHMITYKGETLCPVDWSKRLGGSSNLVFYRLKQGWSEEDAVSIPIGQRLGNNQHITQGTNHEQESKHYSLHR